MNTFAQRRCLSLVTLIALAAFTVGCDAVHYDEDQEVIVDSLTGEPLDDVEEGPVDPRCVSTNLSITNAQCAKTLCSAEYVETGRCQWRPEVGEPETQEKASIGDETSAPGACGAGWSEFIFEHTSSRKVCDPQLMGVSRPNTNDEGYRCVRRGEYCCAHWCVQDA